MAPIARSILARVVPGVSPSITRHRAFAQSGYGDGQGNPISEQPQEQGPNPSADLEHPGPPPVSEGHGSGSSPTKATSQGHNTSASVSSDPSSGSTSAGGAQPKIHDERGNPSARDQSVEEHNRDFGKRHDRAGAVDKSEKETVGKGYWQGESHHRSGERGQLVRD